MHRLRTVTSLDVSAVAGHHAMPAALLFTFIFCLAEDSHEISSLVFSENNEKIFKTVISSNHDWHLKG